MEAEVTPGNIFEFQNGLSQVIEAGAFFWAPSGKIVLVHTSALQQLVTLNPNSVEVFSGGVKLLDEYTVVSRTEDKIFTTVVPGDELEEFVSSLDTDFVVVFSAPFWKSGKPLRHLALTNDLLSTTLGEEASEAFFDLEIPE